jgi:hypothetical protein
MRLKATLLVALLAWLPGRPGAAQSSVLNRVGAGARAAGMGNAFVALSDDGTAASWNPAGLAQLRKPEAALVFGSFEDAYELDGFRSPDGLYAYSPRHFQYTTGSIEFAALAVPFRLFGKPVTAQASWRRLYQLSSQYDEEIAKTPTRAGSGLPSSLLRLDRDSKGDVDLASLALGVRLSRRTLFGFSWDFVRGRWDQSTTSIATPGEQAPSDFASISIGSHITGGGPSLGLLLTHEKLSVGAVYHFPIWHDYELTQSAVSNSAPPLRADGAPGTRFRFPESFALGVAWQPNADWTLSADTTRDRWSLMTVDRPPGSAVPVNFFDRLPTELTSTRDTLSLNLGAERLLRGNAHVIPLRFGVAWEPQGPMDALTRDPVDVLMLAGGLGFNTNRVKLDAAAQVRFTRYRVLEALSPSAIGDGDYVPDAEGTAQLREWRLRLSLIVRVTDTERLKGLLKKVFVGS